MGAVASIGIVIAEAISTAAEASAVVEAATLAAEGAAEGVAAVEAAVESTTAATTAAAAESSSVVLTEEQALALTVRAAGPGASEEVIAEGVDLLMGRAGQAATEEAAESLFAEYETAAQAQTSFEAEFGDISSSEEFTADFDAWYSEMFGIERGAEGAELAEAGVPEGFTLEEYTTLQAELEDARAIFAVEDVTEGLEVSESTAAQAEELSSVETGTLGSRAKKALFDNMKDVLDEFTSGRFTRKQLQQMILDNYQKRPSTGNKQADAVLNRLSDILSGGVVFAEAKEGVGLIFDTLEASGVPIPGSLSNLKGSVLKSSFDALRGDGEEISHKDILVTLDDLKSIQPGIPVGPGEGDPGQPFIRSINVNQGIIPTKDPDDDETPIDEIIGAEGNQAPIQEPPVENTPVTELSGTELYLASAGAQQGIYNQISNLRVDQVIEGDRVLGRLNKDEPEDVGTGLRIKRLRSKRDLDQLVFYDQKGSVVNQSEVRPSLGASIREYSDPHQLGEDVGLLVGNAANEFTNLISQSPDKLDLNNSTVLENLMLKSMQLASNKYPKSAYVASVVYNFLANSDELKQNLGPRYDALAAVYDGRNIAPNKVFKNTSGNFSIVDEVGQVQSYTGSQGSVPSWDTYCGPYGPNDKEPTTLLGTYCFMHDIDYDKIGYFDVDSDFKLISRISQNYTRMGYQERAVAQIAVQWFSNIGVVLGALKTKFLPANIDEVVVDTGYGGVNDIYTALLPENPREEFASYGRQQQTTSRDSTRTSFYQGLRDATEVIFRNNKTNVTGGMGTADIGNLVLWEAFKQLGVLEVK